MEFGLLVRAEDSLVPLIDTTMVDVGAAVETAFADLGRPALDCHVHHSQERHCRTRACSRPSPLLSRAADAQAVCAMQGGVGESASRGARLSRLAGW
jgi:hypothetical protein